MDSQTKKQKFTTIQITRETRSHLDECKVHPRETLSQLIARWALGVLKKKKEVKKDEQNNIH